MWMKNTSQLKVTGNAHGQILIFVEGEVFGIVMLKDMKPEVEEKLVQPSAAAAASSASGAKEDEPEPNAPEPFVYE